MKINTEMKTNIHNKFKIEVKRDDEIIREGFAENIVLDRMYSRLMNFNSFFTRIHVGGGTGTLSPTRTTLFSPIANKEAVVDEKVKDYPVSKVTKKITFGTTEQNGKTFTEVGISESTTNGTVNTHALIKDAEGNPLSITKTDTDVITIYATIFFELIENPNSDGKFNQIAIDNKLIDYVIDGSSFSPSLWIGSVGGVSPANYILWRKNTHSLSRSADNINRINTYSTRLDVGTANYDISELSLDNVYRIDLENAQSWQPYRLEDINIGTGDGVTTTFDLDRYDTSNHVVKVDGVVTTDYTLEGLTGEYKEYLHIISLAKAGTIPHKYYCHLPFNNILYDISNKHLVNATSVATTPILEVDENAIVGKTIEYALSGYSYYGYRGSISIHGSFDGVNFETLHSDSTTAGILDIRTYTFTEPYNYIKIYFNATGADISRTGGVHHISVKNKNYAEPTITFATPPPEGVPVTVSYTVPYIPKTSDYVIDLSLDLHW